MNVERVERVADFVCDPGREQRQRIQPFGLDCLPLRAPALSDVAQNHRVTDALSYRCCRGRLVRCSFTGGG